MNSKQKIYIIGSGAIGKALAVNLSISGKDVVLIRGSVDNQPEINENIKLLKENNKSLEQEVLVTTFSNLSDIDGIVIIATKSFGNKTIAKKLKEKKGNFPVVIMQNGLGVEKEFEKLKFREIYRCVLLTTCHISEDNTLSFKPVAPSPIGIIQGTNSNLKNIVNQINTDNFQFIIDEQIQKIIWEKAIINCAYNSLCPLLEIDNGIFYRNDKVLDLAKQIIKECVELSKNFNITLDEKAIIDRLLFISQKAQGQLISTFQDIRKRRKTEIDSLNLEIARMADEINKPYLVKLTKTLGEMISIKSELSQQKK